MLIIAKKLLVDLIVISTANMMDLRSISGCEVHNYFLPKISYVSIILCFPVLPYWLHYQEILLLVKCLGLLQNHNKGERNVG